MHCGQTELTMNLVRRAVPLFQHEERTRDESEGKRRNAILKEEIRDAKKAVDEGRRMQPL